MWASGAIPAATAQCATRCVRCVRPVASSRETADVHPKIEDPHKPPDQPNRNVGNLILPVPGISSVPLTAVANAARGRRELGFGQTLCLVHGQVLNAPVAMVDQTIIGTWPAGMDRLLPGIQREASRSTGADLPAHDPAREGIDHARDIDKPDPGMDVSEVDHLQPIGPADLELKVDLVQRAGCFGIPDGRHRRLASAHACQVNGAYQALHGALGHFSPLAPDLVPDLAGAIKSKAVLVQVLDRFAHLIFAPRTGRTPAGIGNAGGMFVIGRRDH
jgi:hypothetical protein